MSVALGIDTGGTYTDAALVDPGSGTVLAAAKSLTTRYDLAIGIAGALDAVFAAAAQAGQAVDPQSIQLVGLSTTLATNAIVEDQGTPVCLILVGYDAEFIARQGFHTRLVTRDVVYVAGGHNGQGEEAAPLDEAAVLEAVSARRHSVEAFAVSAYFGVRNPEHERRVRQLISDATGLPVTCAHELTSRLDSVRRATTTALNARLIPLLRELISTLQTTLTQRRIPAPLMIVKGDGSLVQAAWAMQRPIETILSGPAASVVGAWQLAGRRDGWVVDVGGTTTDIAVLRGGLPRLNPAGARIGRWRTMIETVDVHTAGLGGDSAVWRDPGTGQLRLGPRRVIPLCQLAAAHPEVTTELRRQLGAREHADLDGRFVLTQRRPVALSARDRELLDLLDGEPRGLPWLVRRMPQGLLGLRQIELLEDRQVVQRAAFTPTDALHVLGVFSRWDREAARLGAELLACHCGCDVQELCARTVATFSRRLGTELVSKALGDAGTTPDWDHDGAASTLLQQALEPQPEAPLQCSLRLREPIMAVGAPVAAYMPAAARALGTEAVIPPHAEVANAVGAVVNGVVQRHRVLIRPFDVLYRFHLPDGIRDFADLDSGIAHAHTVVVSHLRDLARQAGAAHTEIRMARVDRTAPDGNGGDGEIFVESELVFTAVGGPGLRSV